jgi:hypothetical protein
MRVGRLFQSIVGCIALAASLAPVVAADEVYVSNYYGGRSTSTRGPRTGTSSDPVDRDGTQPPHDVAVDLLHPGIVRAEQPAGGADPAVTPTISTPECPGRRRAEEDDQRAGHALARPAGLAVDSIHQELYVANDVDVNAPILVFPLNANGNVAPSRVLQGPLTRSAGRSGWPWTSFTTS